MSNVSYFGHTKNFEARHVVFNTYVAGMDAIQFLEDHAATGAMHDSEERYPPPMCHPGTREIIIVRIKDWYGFITRPEKPIMWLHAPAGYGKTAIAGTISKLLEEVEGLDFNPLGATFYFWRTSLERNSPTRFIITIAYQLAMSIPELAPYVENAIKGNRLILKKSLEVQLVKLIVEPFKALGDLEKMPNRLIIIDGIDECVNSTEAACGDLETQQAEDQEKAQIRILKLIQALQSYQLPLSFLVLSRPEAWIKQHMQSPSLTCIVEEVDLYTLGDHLNDTERYIRDELARIGAQIGVDAELDGQEQWPGEELVHKFIGKTNGHMLYASIVIRHIDKPYDDPRDALRNFLYHYGDDPSPDLAHSSPLSSIYQMYRQILISCPAGNWQLMIEVLEEIEGASWLLTNQLGCQRGVAIFDRLTGRIPGQGFRALRPLHAVLCLSDPEQPGFANELSLSPYIHSTFSSFLREPCASLGLPIYRGKACERILRGSLDCMSRITPKTEIDEDHLSFALTAWPSLFRDGWGSRPPDAQYLEAVKKLLTIDLSTCLVKAFAIDHPGMFMLPARYMYRTDSRNLIVSRSAKSILESESLVQQAVAHVASSYEAALVHFLDQPPDVWPNTLGSRVIYLMEDLEEDPRPGRSVNGVNQVVQALERLQQERPEDARELANDWEEEFRSLLSLDWIV